jgi:hypothetical protein
MMTFIVVGNFIINASLLDDEHLGKQRVEAVQILNTIINGDGWKNHPICKAWAKYVPALKYYINCIITEWKTRGHKNNMPLYEISEEIIIPWWAKWERLHQSHRAMLYRKNPFYYHAKFTVANDSDTDDCQVHWWEKWLLLHPASSNVDLLTIDNEYMEYGYIWPDNITEDMQNDELSTLTSPIPPHLLDPKYCCTVLKSGKRKGQTCNRIIKDAGEYCGIHLPDDFKNKICKAKLRSGVRRGSVCGRKIKYYQKHCGTHAHK